MKIQFFITDYLPDVFGGAEVYTLHLTQALQAAGHDVMVVSTGIIRKNNKPITEEYQGIPVHRFGFDFDLNFKIDSIIEFIYHRPQFCALQVYRELYDEAKAWFESNRPDVIHVTSAWFMPSILIAAMELNIPVVGTHVDFLWSCRESHLLKPDLSNCTHTDLADCRACYGDLTDEQWPIVLNLKTNLLRAIAQGYSAHHCPCDLLKNQILALGTAPDTVNVWPYGIPDRLLSQRQQKTASDNLRLAFIGRWNRIKGIDLLLDAMEQLVDRPDIELHLYGEQEVWNHDNYSIELKSKAERLTQVIHHGRFNPKQIGDVHQQIDCIVTPSIWPENSPVSILEALALGTPVICSDGAGMTKLITHEHNGLLFKNRDATDLAKQIRALADDRALLHRMQRDVQCLQTISQDVAAFEKIYAEAKPNRDPLWRDQFQRIRTSLFFVEKMAQYQRGLREGKKLNQLAKAGHKDIALFGAGHNLIPALYDTDLNGLNIVAIFDDNPAACYDCTSYYGYDVQHSDQMKNYRFSAIVVTSERDANQMVQRLAPLKEQGIAVEQFYD